MPCIEITPEDFDDMHHALGRPVDPLAKPYRNFYCVEAESAKAKHFEELGMWDRISAINGGRDVTYRVNDDGKSALADWLKLRARS